MQGGGHWADQNGWETTVADGPVPGSIRFAKSVAVGGSTCVAKGIGGITRGIGAAHGGEGGVRDERGAFSSEG